MPRAHTRKAPQAFSAYHVFNREKDRDPMFLDDEDRRTFTWMITRYLTPNPSVDLRGRPYRNLRHAVRLESMALMTNHFHNGLYQTIPGGIEALMNGAMTSYVRYFNRKYWEGRRDVSRRIPLHSKARSPFPTHDVCLHP